MNRQFRHRILAATALAALLAGGTAAAATSQHKDDRQARQEHRQEHRQNQRQEQRADRREAVKPRMTLQEGRKALQQRAVVQARRDDRRDDRHDRRDDRRDDRHDRRDDRHDRRDDRRDDRHDRREDRRDDRHDAQRRIAYARYRQDYDRRMRSIHVRYAPRYYVRPAHYRYFHGGVWYSTSNYGADVLRQAVDWGYREGMRAGRADRNDGWAADYRDSIAWRQGGFGYGGRYVSRADYAYYFRQGFQRGYDDGYFGRMQYGRYVDNDAVIAEAVIATILGLQLLR
jgi:hypothetical protein